MFRKSKTAERVIHAHEIGYRVDEEGNITTPTGRRGKTRVDMWGYHTLTAGPPENRGRIRLHMLAAYQWFGELIFIEGLEIRHLDDNCSNNRKENLALGTKHQNAMDQSRGKRKKRAKHAASFLRKLTEDQVKQLREDRSNGATYKELMAKYDIAKSTVSYIINGRTYR